MSNIDMCQHDWPGTGCRECMREAYKAKVSKLEDLLLDEINEGDPENQYWIDGKHKAMKLLGMEIEE